MKPVTVKLDGKLLKLLDEVSKNTHVPKSALIRKGIQLVLVQTKEDILSMDLRQEIDRLIAEDKDLLRKVA
jgi:metal-responsive CopG/Arc/MetJ family transcriptional regulator